MVALDNIRIELQGYEKPLEEVKRSLNLDDKKLRIQELERNMEAPDFWDDADTATASMKEAKDLKSIVEEADGLSTDYDDIMTLIEMGNEENDESLVSEVEEEFEAFKSRFDTLRVSTMLTGEYDMENAILTLHAGAGGTESCDWASMLCRMYERWADKKE